MGMGKPYASRKPMWEHPESDFYETPYSLIWELANHTDELKGFSKFRDPCCGKHNIKTSLESSSLDKIFDVSEDDLSINGYDFLDDESKHGFIISNPPFSLFDEFVFHAKAVSEKVAFIGRPDAFGAYKRNDAGLWKNLKSCYIFDRKVDYRTPHREDGLFHVGAMVTCWLIWDMSYKGKPSLEVLRVNKYAKLGPFEE